MVARVNVSGRTPANCTCPDCGYLQLRRGNYRPPRCVTNGNPAKNRTFRWNVNAAAYTYPDTATPGTPTRSSSVSSGRYLRCTDPARFTDVCATTGTPNTTAGRAYNFDDWAKFLHNYGIPLTVTVDGETYSERVKVTTYVIDVFNAQQSGDLSSLFFSAADAGGGRYFQAKSEDQIIAAINTALGDILAVSSSFSAVSLPLSATNRARVENQVYIGMFRPAPGKNPRWFGNLKRYQLALFNSVPRLADAKLHSAINPIDDTVVTCAESFWTEDTGTYWENLGVDPAPLRENCFAADVTTSPWSDLPDGPFVEKGGAAQQTRAGSCRRLQGRSTRCRVTPRCAPWTRALVPMQRPSVWVMRRRG